MPRPISTSSFDEEPSADSGIGSSPCPSRSPLNAPELARSASCSHPEQSSERHLRRIQSECGTTRRLPEETPNQSLPHNHVHFASQAALTSWSTGHSSMPTRPQTPYPFQLKTDADEGSDSEGTEKVLTPTKGKAKPTSMNAPSLQLDFTKPPFATSGQSTLGGEEDIEKTEQMEAEQCSMGEAKGNIARASTPIPSLASPTETGQHHKANGMPPAKTHQVYTVQRPSPPTLEEQTSSSTSQIPSLLRVLDANLHPQPHLLRPLAEGDEQSGHTRSRSDLSDVSCTAAPTQPLPSPLPSTTPLSHQVRVDDEGGNESERSVCSCPDQSHRSRPRTNTQRTRETDPCILTMMERADRRTVSVPPAPHIDDADFCYGEVTIPHRCGRVKSTEADKGGFRHGSGNKRLGARVKMAWMRIKGLFCRRRGT